MDYHIVELPNGEVHTLMNYGDFKHLVETKLGYDCSKIVDELIIKSDKVEAYSNMKIDSDLLAYEEQLWTYGTLLAEIKEMLSNMQAYTKSKKVISETNNIIKLINNVY